MHRYTLSYQDLEEMMQERGVEVEHSMGLEEHAGTGQTDLTALEAEKRFLACG